MCAEVRDHRIWRRGRLPPDFARGPRCRTRPGPRLIKRGALVGVARKPTQVRNPDATGIQTKNAAFMSSPLPVAGFAIIEAADLTEAVNLVAHSPCAVAHGVVEVWPLEQTSPQPVRADMVR